MNTLQSPRIMIALPRALLQAQFKQQRRRQAQVRPLALFKHSSRLQARLVQHLQPHPQRIQS